MINVTISNINLKIGLLIFLGIPDIPSDIEFNKKLIRNIRINGSARI